MTRKNTVALNSKNQADLQADICIKPLQPVRQLLKKSMLFQFYFRNTIIIQYQATKEWEDGDCGL